MNLVTKTVNDINLFEITKRASTPGSMIRVIGSDDQLNTGCTWMNHCQ